MTDRTKARHICLRLRNFLGLKNDADFSLFSRYVGVFELLDDELSIMKVIDAQREVEVNDGVGLHEFSAPTILLLSLQLRFMSHTEQGKAPLRL